MRHGTFLVFSIGLVTALITSPMAWADDGARCASGRAHAMSRHGGHGHGHMTSHLLWHLLKNKQELGLTDEQITKLRAVALDADRARIRAEAEVKVSKRELRDMMLDEKVQLPAIEAKVKEKESFDATVRIIGIRAKRELIGVLTPEQKTKLKALWEQRREQDRGQMMRAETGDSINEVNGVEADGEISEVESGLSAG